MGNWYAPNRIVTDGTPAGSQEAQAPAAQERDARTAREREALETAFERARAASRASGAPTLGERLAVLEKLEAALTEHRVALADAISRDFGHRSAHETVIADVYAIVSAIRHARKHLADWMAPVSRKAGLIFAPSSARVVFQPLGVVGIIAPWNYPVQLALSPLVDALAAGNRALVKPSELVPRTAETLAAIVGRAAPSDQVTVVVGGAHLGEAFARLPFDHLVFTGSPRVGKLVMRAASENLVPVTLELGGKSPAIVGSDANVRTAAERIMAGKTFNGGQTCVAPDYALVPVAMKSAFVDACRAAVAKLYPTLGPNPDYTSLITSAHYERIRALVDDARACGATVIELNPAAEPLAPSARKIAPTLLLDVPERALCLKEEIFGPLLPVVTYEGLSAAIAHVGRGERPLALYYFGHRESDIERVLAETTSGGVALNETLLHVLQDDLPFGGVGQSGMGHYHGRDGFEALSKKKPVYVHSRLSVTRLLKPPYGRVADALARLLLRA
jgi:coniferyl-aldehyde dehydrogenase